MYTLFTSENIGPSKRGYTCWYVCFTEFGHVFVVLMKSKSGTNTKDYLKRQSNDVRVSPGVICHAARDKIQGDALLLCNEASCQIYDLEKGEPAMKQA